MTARNARPYEFVHRCWVVRNLTACGRAWIFSENGHPFVCSADISPVRGITRPYGLVLRRFVRAKSDRARVAEGSDPYGGLHCRRFVQKPTVHGGSKPTPYLMYIILSPAAESKG